MKPPDLPKDRPSLIDQAKALGAPAPLKQVVMGVKLAPKPVPQQRIGPDDVTPLPPVHARARAATKTGMPAPPPLLSAPQPPTLPSLPPSAPGSQAGAQGPRSVSPPPWATGPELEAIKREAARTGDRVVEPPISKYEPPPEPARPRQEPAQPPPLWRDPNGLVKVIGALALLGGGGVVGKVVSEPKPSADAAELAQLRVDVARLRERVGDAEHEVDEVRSVNRKLDRRVEQTIAELEKLRKRVPTIEGIEPPKP
jgi:hypothetical protein